MKNSSLKVTAIFAAMTLLAASPAHAGVTDWLTAMLKAAGTGLADATVKVVDTSTSNAGNALVGCTDKVVNGRSGYLIACAAGAGIVMLSAAYCYKIVKGKPVKKHRVHYTGKKKGGEKVEGDAEVYEFADDEVSKTDTCTKH